MRQEQALTKYNHNTIHNDVLKQDHRAYSPSQENNLWETLPKNLNIKLKYLFYEKVAKVIASGQMLK